MKNIFDFFCRLFKSLFGSKPPPPLPPEDGADVPEDDTVVEIIEPIPTPPKHTQKYFWCLDNGHGRKQPGKRSPILPDGRQFLEWFWNREIVAMIAQELLSLGIDFYIVVEEADVGAFLEERVERANTIKSDKPKIFLSVHSNAAPAASGKWCLPSISGIETWFYHNNKKGKEVASVFQNELVTATGWKNRFIKSRPNNQFRVLRETKMTAILTENGFYNNLEQCKELLKEETKRKIARAHVEAIKKIEGYKIKD